MVGDRRSCILIELTDGSLEAFNYPDEESAETWYRECRKEWNDGANVLCYVRDRRGYGMSDRMHHADVVAHLELTTRDDALARGAECREAFIFG